MADASYEARLGWHSSDLLLVPICVLGIAMGVLMFRNGAGLVAVVVAAVAGLVLVQRVIALVSRRVMLRVDYVGITLGTSPPWPQRTTTAVVPWNDVVAVVLWRQRTGFNTMRYIGLERREGSPAMPGSARGSFLRRVIPVFTPGGISNQAACDSRPVSGWSVSRDRLAGVIARFAPHVMLDDRW